MEMRKFPSLKYPNDPETDGVLATEVVVTEKLDGANFRFTWDDDGTLHVGTRNHSYPHDDENIPHAFRHAVEYVKERESDLWGFEDLTLFGKAMHLHSLEYQRMTNQRSQRMTNQGKNKVPFPCQTTITGGSIVYKGKTETIHL